MSEKCLAGRGKSIINISKKILPIENFYKINDSLYIRVLLLESNIKVAFISIEVTSLSDEIISVFKDLVHQKTSIPKKNIFISVTHTFSVPHFKTQTEPIFFAFQEALIKAIDQATSSYSEMKINWSKGKCDINTNRDIPTKNGWWLGQNPNGPSDKTLTVIKVQTLENEPIAIVYNYAIQPSILDGSFYSKDKKLISSDLAGKASQYIEAAYKDELIAIFTIGAAGDQSPILKSNYNLTNKNLEIISNDIGDKGTILVELLGEKLGAEVIKISESIEAQNTINKIQVISDEIICFGQKMPESIKMIHPTKIYNFQETDKIIEPYTILTIGDSALICVRPELTYETSQKIISQSNFPNTTILTLVNGGKKYMADSSAYDQITYEAMNSPFAKGSAEILANQIIQILNKNYSNN